MQSLIAAAATRCPVLSKASSASREALMRHAVLRRLDRGSCVFTHGDAAESGYVLMEGWIKITRTQPCGAISILTLHAPGETFGFSDSIRRLSRKATAEAATACTVLSVSARSICQTMRNDPNFGDTILGHAFQQNDSLLEQLETLKIFSGVQRLACFLIRQAKPDQERHIVRLPFNKNLVAHYLGLKPESLSRSFARLKEHGVRTVPEGIEISDLDALNALVGDIAGLDLRMTA
ncbi:Crp/Fnr family transcriptional regulator [Aquicoccus sp.]